jgi:hypothetical protein
MEGVETKTGYEDDQLHYLQPVVDQHAFLEMLAVVGAQLVVDLALLGEAGHQS